VCIPDEEDEGSYTCECPAGTIEENGNCVVRSSQALAHQHAWSYKSQSLYGPVGGEGTAMLTPAPAWRGHTLPCLMCCMLCATHVVPNFNPVPTLLQFDAGAQPVLTKPLCQRRRMRCERC